MNESSPEPASDTAEEPSLVEDLRLLVAEGRAYAESEIAWQKARAARAGRGIKRVLAFGALALSLVFFSLMALVLGLVLALSPSLTPLGATGAVMAGLLLLAALCGLLASAAWKRTARDIANEGTENG